MNLKEQLAAKKAELVALKSSIEAGDMEAITKAGEIADAIKELENAITAAENAKSIINAMGTPSEDVEENTTKSGMKSLLAQAKSVDRSKKGWSINANFKANTDVVTSVRVPDIERSVESSEPRVARLADLFPQANISGNAVTFFTEGAVEGDASAVQEGSKKPQISTSFSAVTRPLTKVAAYIKETDEVVDDNDFLASVVEGDLMRKVIKAENTYAYNSFATDPSMPSVNYTAGTTADETTVAMMEAILKAKSQIEDNTDYDANIVLMNATDFYAMAIAKDGNGQYFGGGWASGAYGNGSYNSAVTPWGLRVFVSSDVTAGAPIVLASDAFKVYRKNDIAVRVYEQNEDDALYNRVTLLGEERLLVALKNKNAAVKVAQAQ